MATASRRTLVFSRTLIGGLGLLASALPALAQPAFYLMGNVAPGTYSDVYGLSYDGKLASGYHSGPDQGAFTWTPSGGRQDSLGVEIFTGVSRDAQYVTGFKKNPGTGRIEAIRKPVGGIAEYLGVPSGFDSTTGLAMSSDGSAIVGHADRTSNLHSPFRWTASGGMQRITGPDLGNYTYARDVSADGKTIVGEANDTGVGVQRAWVWREGTGESLLLGGESARGITADSRVVVGSGSVGSNFGAVRWIDGVPQYLGIVAGWTTAEAMDVSDDGNVVIGKLRRNAADQDSFVWTPGTGMMMAKDYFTLQHIPYPSDTLGMQIQAVSGDGLSFGGTLAAPSVPQGGGGFVATVPAPSALALGALGCAMTIARHRRDQSCLRVSSLKSDSRKGQL